MTMKLGGPAHFKTCNEQGEEEGGNEEIDSQLYNSDWKGIIKSQAYFANSVILNFYVHMSSQEPDWF
ncbi:MAG: hypothetical protein EZS28_012770 [Streblomastix strix]|uniref:Uncharacterized protein n=1 Tax=Streblomastix strix TaxID=222440 RepID=A0A5J4WAM4_9EUKA|nr:MAG: hypothetical protein EZS28_012770 [Streblomastix strix]